MGWDPVGIGVVLDVLEGTQQGCDDLLNLLIELQPFHHQVAASIGQLRNVLDVQRTDVHAGMACGACEDRGLSEPCDHVLLRSLPARRLT